MADEYVKRQGLLDAYDAAHKGPPGGARKLIAEAPAEDVVPVVRCKDCKKWIDCKMCKQFSFPPGEYSPAELCYTKPDDFCSYGERRGDG